MGGDTIAMLFWSAAMFGIMFFALYLPMLRAIRRVLHGVHPRWPFAVGGATIGVVPAVLIVLLNGGDLRALLNHEALLFYVLFIVLGVVVGIGFTLVYRDDTAAQP